MSTTDRGCITLADTRRALHALHREDPETNAKQMLLRLFEDNLTPADSRGRWKPSRLLLTSVGILLAVLCIFVYFSLK